MDKVEIQSQILSNTKALVRLTNAIHKLPNSETRGELIYKHDKILQRLANLQADLEKFGKNICYYGFSDVCPDKPCSLCHYYRDNIGRE